MNLLHRNIGLPILASLLVCAIPALAQGQSVTPITDGTGTLVNQGGNTYTITGGTQAGSNLFHSFQKFGLDAGQIANFLSNSSIQNILGRVTGGEASLINGLIQVTGSNANLYLMNPAGIIFGANASLNVPGSFTATTANGIGMGNGEWGVGSGEWFNAIGTNDYASLVGTPNSFAFSALQPGAIVNAGDLAVGQGLSLTLLGGTVINTGTLTASEGTINVVAVPGEKLVRITQQGSLLSLDLPIAAKAALNPSPLTPLSLPELLTGGNLVSATGVTVNSNGSVSLTGSGLQIENGDVVAKSVTAQTATLSASNNLTLVESQLRTAGDLNLLAQNTVQMRDSAVNPAIAQSGSKLTIQGNQGVDIVAIDHPASGLISGGDMVLRSASTIRGDAHYITGGSLKLEQLDGGAGNLFSPYDPIILAQGDVSLGNYTGASLHILAGGSVTLGDVVIDNFVPFGSPPIATTANTINPDNLNLFNGSRTFASLAPITRSDGTPLYVNVTPTLDGDGNVQRIPSSTNQLVIDGRNPTLDVRVGVDWNQLGGLPANQIIGAIPTLSATPTSANITVNSIQVSGLFGSGGTPDQPGTILLTNQYSPNTVLPNGTIQVIGAVSTNPGVSIACSGCSQSPDSLGSIVVDARTTVNLGNVQGFSGVNVDLSAVGDISTGRLRVSGPGGGGADPLRTSVTMSSISGNIQVSTIDAGANGIDVQTSGLFQATGVFDANFLSNSQPGPLVSSQPGTTLGNFLIDKGITSPPNQTVIVLDDSFDQNVSLLARTSTSGLTPVTIQYGDGSRLLINETFPAGSGTNRVIVRGGNAGFYTGPQAVGGLLGVTSSDPFLSQVGTGYQEINPANFQVGGGGTRGVVYRNEQYAPLVFGSSTFPTDASGTVGGIAFSGIDATLYGATQNRVFPAITPPTTINPGGGTTINPGGGTSGENIASNGAILLTVQDGQVVQRQLNSQNLESACDRSNSIATTPQTSAQGDRSNRVASGTSIRNPCTPITQDDEQILKILDEAPGSNQNKELLQKSISAPERIEPMQR